MKDPKYALGGVLALAYFVFIGWTLFGEPSESGMPTGGSGVGATVGPLLLLVFAIGWWVSGRTHMSLAFSPPEAQFFFQAPITRRTLLHYKLLKAQLGVAPFALFIGVFLGRILSLPYLAVVISAWVLFTTVHLHQIGSGLIRTSLSSQGARGLRGHWVPLLVLALGAVALAWAFWPLAGAFRTASSVPEFFWEVERAVGHPLAAAVLLPFHIALGGLLVPDLAAWLPGLVGASALLALHYVWIVRIDAAFEEVAAEAGLELQAIAAAFKEGRLGVLQASKDKRMRAPWFQLRPSGHPAVGIFWKGLTGFTRSFGLREVLALSATFLGLWTVLMFATEDARQASQAAASMPAMCVALTLFMGPIFLRHDLRSDLKRQEIIRVLPLSGRDLVAAEIASTTAGLTIVASFFTVFAFGFILASAMEPPTDWRLWLGLVAVLTMLPLVCAVAAGAHNLLAVVFPSWVQHGPTQSQGIDQTGAIMVIMLVSSVLIAAGLIAPLVVGGTIALRVAPVMGLWAAIPIYAGVWLAMAAELGVLVVLLGDAFDEMDPSAEGLLG